MDSSWIFKDYNNNVAARISQEMGLSPITAALLAQRGINSVDDARDFINVNLNDLTNAWLMQGVEVAVTRLRQSLANREKIVIYGDYDVDGICSIVILLECLELLGADVDYYVPNRFTEGYGLNAAAIEALAAQGVRVLVTVDCGISSVDEIAYAAEFGMDVIITDHHTLPPVLPPALAIINPKQDNDHRTTGLAGAGVAFKLASALGADAISQAQIHSWLELVALATVADQVPLLWENRILVKHGLLILEKSSRLGLKALMRATGLEGKPIQSWQVGFILAPRLNSAGRMESASISVELLTCKQTLLAEKLAERLCRMNDERKIIEELIYSQAVSQLEEQGKLHGEGMLVVSGDYWHRGVIGIVASRLSDCYHKPALVITWEGEVGRGSARTAGDFDICSAFRENRDLLLAYGGHKAAAGMSVSREKYEALIAALEMLYGADSQLQTGQKIYRADMEITEEEINAGLLQEIDLLRPFGEGNPAPYFVIRGTRLSRIGRVGKQREHLRFNIGSRRIAGIMFNRGDKSDSQLENCSQDLLFELDSNHFAGQSNLQMKVRDVRPAFLNKEGVDSSNQFHARLRLLSQVARENEAWRPVVFIYPSQRSLVKHQGLIEYFLGSHNMQWLHGQVNPWTLEEAVEELRQGVARIFLTTQAFWQYYLARFDLPDQLRLIVKLWPETLLECQGEDAVASEYVYWELPREAISLKPGLADQPTGTAVIYANRAETVRNYMGKYPHYLVEAGLKDMNARRLRRQDFWRSAESGLISDGTHTPGSPFIERLDRLILADSPLGLYELAAWTDYLDCSQSLSVEVAFGPDRLEHNRRYLRRLYPPAGMVEAVLTAYRQLSVRAEAPILQVAEAIRKHLGERNTLLEIRTALRIAADLGLCRYEKSGSIMATKLLECSQTIQDWESSPYVIEGIAENKILTDWEQELSRTMGW